MTVAPIEEVSEFVLDGTHASPIRTETGVPVLSAQNVYNGTLNFQTDRFTSAEEFRAFRSRLSPQPGDLLLTIVGSIGRAAVVTEARDLVFQRSVAVIRPKPAALNPRFLYWATQTPDFQSQLAKSANQSSQAGVYLGKLKKLLIPLPPLPEQCRIAAVLDQADALRAKRRAAIARLDTLVQSIFLDMFGDPATNPKGWPIRAFGILTANEDGRRVPVKVSQRDGRHGPYPYYGASGIVDWIDEYLFDGERLLIGEDGANLLTRSTPIAFIASGQFWVNNHAHVLRETHEADLRFLEAFIDLTDVTRYVTGSAQPKLTQASLNRVPVPTPPPDSQRAFRRQVERTESLLAVERASLTKLDALFTSLQARAFRGEL